MDKRFVGLMALLVSLGLMGIPSAFSQKAGDVYMWDFNEGSGDKVTDNSKQMTATMGTALTPESISVSNTDSPSGKAGDRSVQVNGGLLVDDSQSPVLNIEKGPITMEAWVKIDAITEPTDIARYGGAYKFGFGNNGALLWTFLGIEDVFSDTIFSPDSAWHHIAMAWEPGKGVTFFLDGQQVDFKATTNTDRALQSHILNIGTDSGGTSALQGSIDRLRIHKAILTAA